jgi:hypothetical protein
MLKLLITMGLSLAAYGAVARPGTINYIEGQVTIDGHAVTAQKLGNSELSPGGVLATSQGKAEMLLTPGVFLRLDDQSAVRMVSPSLTDTRVDLLRGRAMLEVDLLEPENHLQMRDRGADIRIQKRGIYAFDADRPEVAVYDGKAAVQVNDKTVEVGKGKELPLDPPALKPQKFDRHETDDLYAWSKLRSQYLADANASSAQTIVGNNPGWWAGTGWYWNPWYSTWSFIPGSGYLYNPWGFGFYSPSYWGYYGPTIYYSRPSRVWVGRGGGVPRSFPSRGMVTRPSGSIAARPAPAPVGGSGIRFGSGRR